LELLPPPSVRRFFYGFYYERKMSIKAKNISVWIGEKSLLEDVSFEANPGEVIVIFGANGAGKSTLLKTLSGEIEPSDGEIFFADKNLNEWKMGELSKIRAVLPQSFAMDFPFKAKEVTLLGRTPHIKFSESSNDYEIADSALKLVEAEEFTDRFYPTLSGGEKQRIQLARVLTQIWEKPKDDLRYLLLDEPTASLDLAHQHLTLQTARDFADKKTVVVAVLHDLNLAAQYADKILILKNGKTFAFDEPKKVLNSKIIQKVFGIEVYITKHAKNYDVPLIVPIGRCQEKTFRARV
jgi:iron complex transport system ATP-binding protein